ncbi:MAG: hypothetical protein ABSD27_08720 [Bryobacteraceae bacterium]|jgi:hypothetical protein
MLFRGLVLAMAALPLAAQSPDSGLAQRLREHLSQYLLKLPNYTCVQTTERWRRGLEDCPQCERMDRVRLEIAVINGREMFGYPGSAGFGQFDPVKLLQGGVAGRGDFANGLVAILRAGPSALSLAGEDSRQNRRLLRYSYHVPATEKPFEFGTLDDKVSLGIHGDLWIDPRTLDLVRMEIVAENVPERFHVSSLTSVIDYRPVQIATSEFLLPGETEWLVVYSPIAQERRPDDPAWGVEYSRNAQVRNQTSYSQCRAYVAESSLRFDADAEVPTPLAGAAAAPSALSALPTGLSFSAKLQTAVDLRLSAAGDSVVAKVTKPAAQSGRVIVPEGAEILGRIVNLEARALTDQYGRLSWHSFLGIRFTALRIGTTETPLAGRLSGARLPGNRCSAQTHKENPEGLSIVCVGRPDAPLPAGLTFDWRTK